MPEASAREPNASVDTRRGGKERLRIVGNSQELYERWREIAELHKNDLALVDCAAGEEWTFQDLQNAVEGRSRCGVPVAFPGTRGAAFVLELLNAWRSGAVSCPLEPGQPVPVFPSLPAEAAHLKLTSGSTGSSKCVVFTAEQLAADARNIAATMSLRPEWPNLAAISLAHSYGFSNLVLPLLLHGIPLLIAAAPLPEVILQCARPFPAITLPAVPALWRTWLESNSVPRNVKLAISAGAPLPLELERGIFARHGIKVHNFYGSSECGGIAFDRTQTPREDESLAGTALDNVRLSIGEAGTLVVEGAAVGARYWPEAHESLGGGRFVTADLAELRAGEVLLRGRTSDLINVAGRKVAPERIESVLRKHPAVAECVVFGVPAQLEDRFELIVGAIKAVRPLPVSDLQEFLSTELPAWQIPRQWWFCPELSSNERGKISRREWRGKYLERVVKPVA